VKWLSCILFLGVTSVCAQLPLPQEIHRFEGLPTSTIYNVIQDEHHYVWLGTEKGLLRYDGKRFVAFSNVQMRSMAVSDLRFDADKKLHCQNFSGQHFVMKGDSLHLEKSLAITGNYAPVLEGDNGYSYQWGYNMVYKSNGAIDTILFKNEIYGLFRSKGDVYTFDADSIYDVSANKPAQKIPFSLAGETVFFLIDIQGRLLFFPRNHPGGVCYQFFPDFKVLNFSIPKLNIQTVHVVDEQIFIGTNSGLYVYDKTLKPVFASLPLLPNKSISDVCKTADGDIWVSTLDNGLYKYSCWNCLAIQSEEAVSSMFFNAPASELYFGTVGGKVMKWSAGAATQEVFKSNDRERFRALYYDNANRNLFMAGDAFTIMGSNGVKHSFKLAVKQILPIAEAQYILPRTGGLSFLATKHASATLHPKVVIAQDKQWLIYENFFINNANVRVKAVSHDGAKNITYAATSIGLLAIDNNKWVEIKEGGNSIDANDVKWRNDSLFIASNNGLMVMKNGKLLHRWSASNSILPNVIKSLQVERSAVWAVFESALYRIQLSNGSIQLYNLTNGHEINDLLLTNEQLFMATDVGVVVVPLGELPSASQQLQLHLEHFKTDNQLLNFTTVSTLRHDDNNLKLDFSIPFFGRPDEVKVLYKVNNESWQAAEPGQRQLNFISLQPNEYKVQLKARAADGRESNIQVVSFCIRSPFWKTWWFYTLSLLAVVVTTYLVYRYRLKLLQDKNKLEQQKIDLENKLRESILASVKAQMNPHFIFNALNTIQSFIYLNDKQNATSYLGKFSQLTRTILEMSNKSSVSLQAEIDAILIYLELEKIRFDEKLNFVLEISPEIDANLVHIPSMIIQPYIENAIKHGLLHKKENRQLLCSFQLQNKMLKVIIDDNGIGRKRSAELNKIKNQKHESFATNANEKRLKALNRNNVEILNVRYIDKLSAFGESDGTTVELLITILDE